MIEIDYISSSGEKCTYAVQLSEDPFSVIMLLIREKKAIITDVREVSLCQDGLDG